MRVFGCSEGARHGWCRFFFLRLRAIALVYTVVAAASHGHPTRGSRLIVPGGGCGGGRVGSVGSVWCLLRKPPHSPPSASSHLHGRLAILLISPARINDSNRSSLFSFPT